MVRTPNLLRFPFDLFLASDVAHRSVKIGCKIMLYLTNFIHDWMKNEISSEVACYVYIQLHGGRDEALFAPCSANYYSIRNTSY